MRVSRKARVSDLLETLRALLPPDAHAGRPLRLMEVYQWKIWQLFDPDSLVEHIGDSSWYLRAEAVPEGQEGLAEAGPLHAHVLHVTIEQPNNVRGRGGGGGGREGGHLVLPFPWGWPSLRGRGSRAELLPRSTLY